MQLCAADPANAEQVRQVVQTAGDHLRAGELVVLPTETVYGIAASAANADAVHSLRKLKGLGEDQPFTVHLADPAAADRYVDLSRPALRRLVEKLFPGPVVLVIDESSDVVEQRIKSLSLDPPLPQALYRGSTISLRCPDHELTRRILDRVSEPVVLTSARQDGSEPARDAQSAVRLLGDRVACVVDGGRCRFGRPSSVVRVRADDGAAASGLPPVQIEREGVYDERYLRKLMQWTVLLVCSGNTCRSPMAEGVARQLLAEQRGVRPEALEQAGLHVMSAGTMALAGAPASPEAVDVLRRQKIDIANHRSRPVTLELIHQADVIYCMTEAHRQAVLSMEPAAAEKTHCLDPAHDVDDPVGRGLAAYQRTAEMIRRRLAHRLKEQQL